MKKGIWNQVITWVKKILALDHDSKKNDYVPITDYIPAKITRKLPPQEPFIFGLDNLSNVDTLLTKDLLGLCNWESIKPQPLATLSAKLPDEVETEVSENFSTEIVLESIHWDYEVTSFSKLKNRGESSALSGIIGLDNLPNLESLTTVNLLNLLNWEAEGQTILSVEPDDLALLDDLLAAAD